MGFRTGYDERRMHGPRGIAQPARSGHVGHRLTVPNRAEAFSDGVFAIAITLLVLELVFLMTVSILPFPTAIVSEYLLSHQGGTAAMIYSLNMALMGVTFGMM